MTLWTVPNLTAGAERFSKDSLTQAGSPGRARRGKGSRGERARIHKHTLLCWAWKAPKAQENPLQQRFKRIKKRQVLFLYLGVSMKCQIKTITRYHYSKKADKELKRGNFETHVPSHRCPLNTRQRLPVGLQTKKTFSCPKVLRGLVRTAPRTWNQHGEFQLPQVL